MNNIKIPKKDIKQIRDFLNSGTKFQQSVWLELKKIPKGQTRTYQQIANQIGNPKAVRAVASAIAANQIFYHIPCHRVIRSTGQTGEYRWGKELKEKLIKMEEVTQF